MPETKMILKRISPKPYPVAGPYFPCKSPATRACIKQNEEGFFVVNVWDCNRQGYPWGEESYSRLHNYIKLSDVGEAKKWLVENYGGKWKEIM